MRQLLGTIMQALLDAEAAARIGTGPHEPTDVRTTQRDGTRDKKVTTTAGGPGRSRFRRCAPGRSSRRCWRLGAGSTSRCTRW